MSPSCILLSFQCWCATPVNAQLLGGVPEFAVLPELTFDPLLQDIIEELFCSAVVGRPFRVERRSLLNLSDYAGFVRWKRKPRAVPESTPIVISRL